jgi:hypothetical protein
LIQPNFNSSLPDTFTATEKPQIIMARPTNMFIEQDISEANRIEQQKQQYQQELLQQIEEKATLKK